MEYKNREPAQIEQASMDIIASELKERGITVPDGVRPVLMRVIHTTADFDYAENLICTKEAVSEALKCLRRHPVIVTDTNMALAGINKRALDRLEGRAVCYMGSDEIMRRSKEERTTRAAVSMRKGIEEYPDAVFAVGNAPTALITLSDLIRAGARPSLIIAVPVGFVNVVESKEEIVRICREYDIPVIAAMGRKGGSSVAASVCNALLYMAAGTLNPAQR